MPSRATCGLTTFGSQDCTESAANGMQSDAAIAASQIQRVPPRLSRRARSATYAPTESSSVTMIT